MKSELAVKKAAKKLNVHLKYVAIPEKAELCLSSSTTATRVVHSCTAKPRTAWGLEMLCFNSEGNNACPR